MTDPSTTFWSSFGYELSIPARKLSPADVVDLAASAQRKGWRGVWLSEVLSLDAAVLAGALTQSSPGLRIGTSIVPVSTRSAALLAMMAATAAGLAPGRFALGLGVSTPTIVDERHDRGLVRPVASTRGVLSVVRRALRGDVVDHPADPVVSRLRIDPPVSPPPVLLAALGPKMLQVAHEHADGVILNLVPLAVAADIAAQGRQVSGSDYATLLTQRVCISPTEADLASVRREVASYCRVDVYGASLARSGWALEELQAAPPDQAARHLPEELLHELVVLGSARECRERIDAIAAAGVRPVVVPVGAGDPARRLLEVFLTGQ